MSIFSRVFAKLNGPGTTGDAAFEKQVRHDGIEHASSRIAELVNEKIQSKEVAIQFVLEELDAARNGNDIAVDFALNSGYSPYEYIGALEKTTWEDEESELEHVQLFLRHFGAKISDIDLRVELGVNVVDKIMRKWKLGKYNTARVDNDLMDELIEMTEKKEVISAIKSLLESQALGTNQIGIGQKVLIDKFENLVDKISNITGKTHNEIIYMTSLKESLNQIDIANKPESNGVKFVDMIELSESFAHCASKNGIDIHQLQPDKAFHQSYVAFLSPFYNTSEDYFNSIILCTNSFDTENELVEKHKKGTASTVDSYLFMSNAYAARAAALGAMLHGELTENVAQYFSISNFNFAQQATYHNNDFQNFCAMSAWELIKTVVPGINLEGFRKYCICASSNFKSISFPYETSNFIQYDEIFNFFREMERQPEVTSEMIIDFVDKTACPI
jgi:hypothetical protein